MTVDTVSYRRDNFSRPPEKSRWMGGRGLLEPLHKMGPVVDHQSPGLGHAQA